jgi:hypothetical protein
MVVQHPERGMRFPQFLQLRMKHTPDARFVRVATV